MSFSSFNSLEDIREDIRTVGRAVGAEEEAETTGGRNGPQDSLSSRSGSRPRASGRRHSPMAKVDGWPDRERRRRSVRSRRIAKRRGRNRNQGPRRKLSEEQVLAMDPDYLVVVVAQSVVATEQKAWLMENPALAPLRAIRDRANLDGRRVAALIRLSPYCRRRRRTRTTSLPGQVPQ